MITPNVCLINVSDIALFVSVWSDLGETHAEGASPAPVVDSIYEPDNRAPRMEKNEAIRHPSFVDELM